MHSFLLSRSRDLKRVSELFGVFPIVALLGARQCGKTTLARQMEGNHYFDLENPSDLARFQNPQLTLEPLKGLIIIDEIQRQPNLFPLLRHLVDKNTQQKYLILGSASRDLIRQSSESLAGRIGYHLLTGISAIDHPELLENLWIRGGFPRSLLAQNDVESVLWRENYITTFLERDIPQLGIQIPSATLRRFWTMLSHYHGQILNYSELSRSFGISDVTVRRYIEILNGTFMTRTLQPWFNNTQKRLIKSPKLYLRDSGLFHSLQTIPDKKILLSHPKLGASWEGFALESVCQKLSLADERYYFWGTHAGAELDLFWKEGGKNWGIEIKYQEAPQITKSLHTALKDLRLHHVYVIYPGTETYLLEKRVTAISLPTFLTIPHVQ